VVVGIAENFTPYGAVVAWREGRYLDALMEVTPGGKLARLGRLGRHADDMAPLTRRADDVAPPRTHANDIGPRMPDQGDGCFVAGTLVHTRAGLKAIEDIEVGDFVLGQTERGGERGHRRVIETFVYDDKAILAISIADRAGAVETIHSTSVHPFWVKGVGWTGADYLNVGDTLELHDGRDATITALRDTGELKRVYNFTVEGFHTYYVGELGVWVHNVGVCPQDGPRPPQSALGGERTYADPDPRQYEGGISPDTPVIDHNLARALGGGNEARNLNIRSWAENARKGGFEGQYQIERTRLIEGGLTPSEADWVLEPELRWIRTDVHASPVDPTILDRLRSP
jgi:Pretoxin HINT domain